MGLVRFYSCACRFRTNAPGPFSDVGEHSVRPRAAEVVGPYGQTGRFPHFVGAAHRAARERPDEGIGPYEKNATTPVSAVSLRTT